MLKVSFIEIIERGLPESILFIWACCLLTRTKLKFNKFFIIVIIFSFLNYIVRLLPIQYGVNTMLGFGILIFVNINLTKIPIVKAIKVSLFVFITEFICEIINLVIIKYILKVDIIRVFSNPESKTIYGIPSLILFTIIILIASIALKKIAMRRDILNNNDIA